MNTLITDDLITRISNLHDLAKVCRETGKPDLAEYFDKTALDVLCGVQRENLAQLPAMNPRVAQYFALRAFAQDIRPAFKRMGDALNVFWPTLQKSMAQAYELQQEDVALQA